MQYQVTGPIKQFFQNKSVPWLIIQMANNTNAWLSPNDLTTMYSFHFIPFNNVSGCLQLSQPFWRIMFMLLFCYFASSTSKYDNPPPPNGHKDISSSNKNAQST